MSASIGAGAASRFKKIKAAPGTAALGLIDAMVKLALVVFLLAPAVLVVVLSFSAHDSLLFPPREWGMRQYTSLMNSAYWLDSIKQSFAIAIPTAILALAVGVPASFALQRSRIKGKTLLQTLAVAPIILPGAAYAVALYLVYAQARVLGNFWGVVIAETSLAVPFVILIVGAGLRRIPLELEQVAMSLGASRWQATYSVTLRLLIPSIAAAAVLCFVLVFDEVILVNFLGGGQVVTLPKAIYDSFRTGTEPLITAVAALLMLLTGGLMVVLSRLRKIKPL